MNRGAFVRRPLFLCGLCALLGVLTAQYSLLLSLFAALLVFCTLFLLRRRPFISLILALLLLFFAAYTSFYEAQALSASEAYISDDTTLEGRIVSLPRQRSYGQSFILQCENTRLFVMCYQKGASFGDVVVLHADCMRPEGPRREGDFHFPNYLKSQRIYLVAYAEDLTVVGHKKYPTDIITTLRAKLLSRADTLWSGQVLMFIRSLLFGNSDLSSADFRDTLSRAGLSHIIAVSGLHVNLIIGMVAALFYRGFIRRRFYLIGLFLLLFLYVLLTGASPSALRAALMLSLLFLSMIFSAPYDGLSALSFAALCLLTYNPFIIYSLSFLLSFAAVSGILLFYRPLEKYLEGLPASYAVKLLAVTLCAQVFTFPILVLSFGRVACLSLLANLAVLPLVPVIMLCGYAALAFSSFSIISLPAARFCEALIRFILWIADRANTLPFSVVSLVPASTVLFLLSYGAIVCLFVSLLILKKRIFVLLSAVLILCSFFVHAAFPVLAPRQCLCFLDAGTGDATVAISGKNAVMIECRSTDDTFAETVVIPFLKRNGLSSLDVLAIAEYNSYDPNVRYLITHFPVARLMMPDSQGDEALIRAAQGAGTRLVGLDESLSCGALSLSAYTAGKHVGFSLYHPTASVFFAGTLKEGDKVFQASFDLLKIGLGGRDISLDPALLSAVRPKAVIISSRYRPSNKLLSRIGDYPYYTTAQGGSLYVESTKDGVSIIPYLKEEEKP